MVKLRRRSLGLLGLATVSVLSSRQESGPATRHRLKCRARPGAERAA